MGVPMAEKISPVDERLPLGRLIALGLQHVLVMYAGAVAVPLILGGALKLPKDQVALLINADLFACGIATLVQAFGVGPFGIRLPVMMGVTFAAVSPMLALAGNPELGLLGIYGAVIVAGIFGMIIAPLVSRLLPFFPAVVTGSIITTIGITLMRIGINWAGGGFGAKDFGAPAYLGIAALVLIIILLLLRFGAGFVQNIAVLIGIVVGYVLTVALGWADFAGLGNQPWVDIIYPFQFGVPKFDVVACISMCLVMIVVMIESTGMFLAIGDMVGRPVQGADLARGLRADGLGTLIGGIFNTFPYTSFSQNVGLVGVTGIKSRYVCVAGGIIMVILGLVRRRRCRDVRHGRGDRHQDSVDRRFRQGAPQSVHRRDFDRLRDDPAGGADLVRCHAENAETDARQRHPAGVLGGGAAQCLFQRAGNGGRRARRRGCGRAGRRSHLRSDIQPAPVFARAV